MEHLFDGFRTIEGLATGDRRTVVTGRPESRIRELLGFKSIMVITSMEYKGYGEFDVKELHYEWKWRPFRKR